MIQQINQVIAQVFDEQGSQDAGLKRMIGCIVLKEAGYKYEAIATVLHTSKGTVSRDADKFEGYLMYPTTFPNEIALYEAVKNRLANLPTIDMTEEIQEEPPLVIEAATSPPTTEAQPAPASPFADAPVIDRTIKTAKSSLEEEEDEEDWGDENATTEDAPEEKIADSFNYDNTPTEQGTVGAELPPAQVKFTSDSLLDLLTFYTPKALCFFTNINVRQVENEALVGNMPEDAPVLVAKKNELNKEAYAKVVDEYKPFLQKSILGVVKSTKLNIKPEYMFVIHFIGFGTQLQNVVREVNKSNSELLEQLRKEAKSEVVK